LEYGREKKKQKIAVDHGDQEGKKTAREVPGVLRKEKKKKNESENHEIFRQ
jgi:hypothetical protein